MKRVFLLAATLLLSGGAASAQTIQAWTPGWDNFSERLDFTNSSVRWSVGTTSPKLTATYKLVHARPSKLYQVGVHIFCDTFPPTFGRFPVRGLASDGTCPESTRQGVTARWVSVEFGVVTTDIHGNGLLTVSVGQVAAGTYNLEFDARDGAGCLLTGGGSACAVDFQSPGPFGTVTTIIVP